MKKKIALLLILVMSLAILGSGCGGGTKSESEGNGEVDTGEVYELKVSHIASLSDPIHQGWTLLKETLEEKSNGRIKVTIFGNK